MLGAAILWRYQTRAMKKKTLAQIALWRYDAESLPIDVRILSSVWRQGQLVGKNINITSLLVKSDDIA